MPEMHTVRVRQTEDDPRGREVAEEAQRSMGLDVGRVATAQAYILEGVTADEARQLASKLLTDPLTQEAFVDEAALTGDVTVVPVRYLPGMTEPDDEPIHKATAALGLEPAAISLVTEHAFDASLDGEKIGTIVDRLLVNKTVQEVLVDEPATLLYEGKPEPFAHVPMLELNDVQLIELSKDKLFLDESEMKVIQEHFRELGRNPTDVELEHLAAAWSEHCGHKTFKAKVIVDGVEKEPFIKRIISKADEHSELVATAFEDNAGGIYFYDGMVIVGKVETHNSPSALDPYGGAMTGSGGVFRDIMGVGQGAKTIISMDIFCVAPPDLPDERLPEGTLRPDYILRGVVNGVRDYGNRMGIPTGNGSVHFNEAFRAKPTVLVGAFGSVPEKYALKGQPKVGDLVVTIGGKTGKDGLHGATFSSGDMTSGTQELHSSAVQIGAPIEEKRMFDALIEARDADFIRAMTDCGAAGFASAIGEMGEDIGVTVDISKAPLKYQGLSPWEIWLSESQERMVAAVSPDNIEGFIEICKKYNVEATVLGEFDGSRTLTVNYGDENVVELDYEFMKHGLPQRVMEAKWERPEIEEITPEAPKTEQEWIDLLSAVLTHGDVCSKESIVRQYDHGVQGGNIVPPYGGETQEGPNDALVIRTDLQKKHGIVQSHGMNPRISEIDPRGSVECAVAEAAANLTAVGGNFREAALVGNYVTASPDAHTMGALDQMVDGACEMMDVLGVPVISGKDSLSSTFRGQDGEVITIPPVYTASMFGRIPDVDKTVTSDIKRPGKSRLYMIGVPSDGMGGSVYHEIAGGSSAKVPTVDKVALPKNLVAVKELIQSEKVLAAHDVSEGGVFTTISEMCFGGDAGVEIVLPKGVDRTTFLLNETAGCLVLEVPEDMNIYMELYETLGIAPADVTVTALGRTTEEKTITATEYAMSGYDKDRFFAAPTDVFKAAWQKPMKEVFHG